ncbi:MAG: VCBS repeat-containing protein [Armatimonadota bacterium]|nr:VCBS repeat-containing protein [Armatimonadota bacterium]
MSPTKSTAVLAVIAAVTLMGTTSREASAPQAGVHPIVDVQSGMLFGGTVNGRWTGPRHLAPRLTEGGSYRLYGLTRVLGHATGGKATSLGAPCEDNRIVSLHPNGNQAGIAVGGDWNALPRPVRAESVRQPVYQSAVRALLESHGLRRARVNIRQVLRCDLDGDGVEEVLICASNPIHQGTWKAMRGDYSLVVLRRVIDGKVKTTLIEQEFHGKDCPNCVPDTFHIAGVLDVNGDGRMEVVTGWQYYEGEGMTIYEIKGQKARPVLAWACGA